MVRACGLLRPLFMFHDLSGQRGMGQKQGMDQRPKMRRLAQKGDNFPADGFRPCLPQDDAEAFEQPTHLVLNIAPPVD